MTFSKGILQTNLLLIGLLFLPYLGFSQDKINWMTWDEMTAQRDQDSVKKKIFMDFTTGWCGWCKKMDATTFADKDVIQYMNKNYYAVKFDAETRDTIIFNDHIFTNSQPEFVKASERSRGKIHWFAYTMLDGKASFPSYTILDEKFTRLVIYPGYKGKEDLMGILIFFATNQYAQYHNYLNGLWNAALKQEKAKTEGK